MFSKETSCINKVLYHTWEEANRALKRSQHRDNVRKTAARLHIYKCEHCAWWHLGHESDSMMVKQGKRRKKDQYDEDRDDAWQ